MRRTDCPRAGCGRMIIIAWGSGDGWGFMIGGLAFSQISNRG